MARKDSVAIVLLLMLVAAIMAPMALRLRRAGQMSRCQANLRIIGSGLRMDALQRGDAAWVRIPDTDKPVRYVGLMDYRNVQQGPEDRSVSVDEYMRRVGAAPRDLTTSRYIWAILRVNPRPQSDPLIRSQGASVEDFICPASTDVPADGATIKGRWFPAESLYDFGSWNNCSYGVQVPFQATSAPRLDAPPSMVMVADKGPWSRVAELDRELPRNTEIRPSVDQDWRRYNSPNHSRSGQNIYSADGSVGFRTDPLAGVDKDNIYTARQAGSGEATQELRTGYPPSLRLPCLLPAAPTDTLIYP